MIRSITVANAIRIASLGGPDWAINPWGAAWGGRRLFSPARFLLEYLRARPRGAAWVAGKGLKASGLASAKPRSGPTAWIVDHLVTPRYDASPCCELLEKAAIHAGRRGADRLFLQLLDDGQLVDMVRSSGFVPCARVLLFTLSGQGPLLDMTPVSGLRKREPSDDLPLFRLYTATTPADVRSGIGLTLEQWKDSQEPLRRGTQELVLEEGDGVKGWLRLDLHRRWATVRLSIQPGWDGDITSLVALAQKKSGQRVLWWEVPESDGTLRLALERVGFDATVSYQLLVKFLAVRVKEPVLANAPTSG